jgi:hypothetical protein
LVSRKYLKKNKKLTLLKYFLYQEKQEQKTNKQKNKTKNKTELPYRLS